MALPLRRPPARSSALLGLAGAFAGIALLGRRAHGAVIGWGATPWECDRVLPGDEFVPGDRHPRSTFAITIGAHADEVWPWLVQLGKGRGGLYSYDFLDRLFGILDEPSVTGVLPEWQGLKVGDVVPLGRSDGWPVLAMEAGRSIVLGGGNTEWNTAWAFVLEPAADGGTRLITRFQGAFPPSLKNRLVHVALWPAAFLMTRRMLLNLKDRAEGLAAAR